MATSHADETGQSPHIPSIMAHHKKLIQKYQIINKIDTKINKIIVLVCQ
jgi:hypothetical protein